MEFHRVRWISFSALASICVVSSAGGADGFKVVQVQVAEDASGKPVAGAAISAMVEGATNRFSGESNP